MLMRAELEIRVLPQALGHVGNQRPHAPPMPDVANVPVEDSHLPLLDLLGSGDEGHERRLAYAVRPHDADHDATGNVQGDAVEGYDPPIPVRHVFDRNNHGLAEESG